MDEKAELEAARRRIRELEKELHSQKHALQKVTRKWKHLIARQKRANRLSPFDLLLLEILQSYDSANAYNTDTLPCLQVLHSSWDQAPCAQTEQEATLLRLGATALDAAEGLKGNLWHPLRGRGNRLSLLPTTHSHKLLIHATAIRYSTEQTAATCAAAAAAAAWNICCAPGNGCALALGVAQFPIQRSPHDTHEVPQDCRPTPEYERTCDDYQQYPCNRIASNELGNKISAVLPNEAQLLNTAGAQTTIPRVEAERVDARHIMDSTDAEQPPNCWPLFEKDLLEVFAVQERRKLIASETAVSRALGGATAVDRAESCSEVNTWLKKKLLCKKTPPLPILDHAAPEYTSSRSDQHDSPSSTTESAHALTPSAALSELLPANEEHGSNGEIPNSTQASASKLLSHKHSQNTVEGVHAASVRVQSTGGMLVYVDNTAVPTLPSTTSVSQALQSLCKPADITTAGTLGMVNHHDRTSQGGTEDNESDTNTSSTADEERSMVASITSVPVGRTVNAAGDFHAPQHQPPASSATIVKKLKDGPGRTESPSDGHMTQVSLKTQELVASAYQRGSLQWRALVHACRNVCKHEVNLMKLTHKLRPSTAPIGTLRLIAALRSLASKYNKPLKVWKIFARSRAEASISATDSAESINEQWALLCSHLQASDTALIFHLENHYSVIYGIREWKSLGNVQDAVQREASTQQILVGKPGQAPNRWIDWEDVRACLLGWQGYGIVGVQRTVETTTSCGTESC